MFGDAIHKRRNRRVYFLTVWHLVSGCFTFYTCKENQYCTFYDALLIYKVFQFFVDDTIVLFCFICLAIGFPCPVNDFNRIADRLYICVYMYFVNI